MLRLVGRVDMQNGLAPNPCVVVKNGEGYHSFRGPCPGEWGISPLCWEEEPTKHLAVKNQQGSVHPGEMKSYWEYRCPLKRSTQRLSLAGTHSGLWRKDSGRRTACQGHQRHIGRNWVAWLPGEGWKDSHHYSWIEPFYHMAKSESALTWWTPLAPLWRLPETMIHQLTHCLRLFLGIF